MEASCHVGEWAWGADSDDWRERLALCILCVYNVVPFIRKRLAMYKNILVHENEAIEKKTARLTPAYVDLEIC
jgi:hypothetical protein